MKNRCSITIGEEGRIKVERDFEKHLESHFTKENKEIVLTVHDVVSVSLQRKKEENQQVLRLFIYRQNSVLLLRGVKVSDGCIS